MHLKQSPKDFGKGTGRLGYNRTSEDYPDYSIIKIGQKRLKETCCHSNSSEKPSNNAGMINSQRSKIIMMMMMIMKQEQK